MVAKKLTKKENEKLIIKIKELERSAQRKTPEEFGEAGQVNEILCRALAHNI